VLQLLSFNLSGGKEKGRRRRKLQGMGGASKTLQNFGEQISWGKELLRGPRVTARKGGLEEQKKKTGFLGVPAGSAGTLK